MEQTIKIEVPDGKEAIWNELTNSIIFVDKKPLYSKSWEEFCENNPKILDTEWYLSSKGPFSTLCEGVNREEAGNGYLNSKEDAEGIYALVQLTRLHDEWIGDWKPNYTDTTEKWHIYFHCNKVDIAWSNMEKRFLAFPTQIMAQEFLECFENLIKTAKKFI